LFEASKKIFSDGNILKLTNELSEVVFKNYGE
jgi:hypothetical protein